MNFTVWHNDAPSGAAINSRVELLLPADDEKFPAKPWRAQTRIDGHTMMTSHHETRAEASTSAERSHTAHLEVHSDYPEYRSLRDAERTQVGQS